MLNSDKSVPDRSDSTIKYEVSVNAANRSWKYFATIGDASEYADKVFRQAGKMPAVVEEITQNTES